VTVALVFTSIMIAGPALPAAGSRPEPLAVDAGETE